MTNFFYGMTLGMAGTSAWYLFWIYRLYERRK